MAKHCRDCKHFRHNEKLSEMEHINRAPRNKKGEHGKAPKALGNCTKKLTLFSVRASAPVCKDFNGGIL